MFSKLITPFFEEPNREFGVREFARIAKISPATASKELKQLTKDKILTERKDRIYKLYKADLESEKYTDAKIFYNLTKIKDSNLINSLNSFYLKPTIILFGSASTGLDTEDSDIDLLIISEKKEEFKEKDNFEKKLKRKIQIFVVKDIKELNNPHLINNIIKGITIQGGIKWI